MQFAFSAVCTIKNTILATKLVHRVSVKYQQLTIYVYISELYHKIRRGERRTVSEPMIVDHPFIFMMYDKCSNSILFMEKIYNPKE